MTFPRYIGSSHPIWLRKQLSDSVMRRAVRAAVEAYGHQKFILATKESTAPPTGQLHAIDATAAGQPIYASSNGIPLAAPIRMQAKLGELGWAS